MYEVAILWLNFAMGLNSANQSLVASIGFFVIDAGESVLGSGTLIGLLLGIEEVLVTILDHLLRLAQFVGIAHSPLLVESLIDVGVSWASLTLLLVLVGARFLFTWSFMIKLEILRGKGTECVFISLIIVHASSTSTASITTASFTSASVLSSTTVFSPSAIFTSATIFASSTIFACSTASA